MIAAGTTGLIAATAAGTARAAARGRPEAGDGTPEQVHLTWGDDPARVVVVSWVSAGRADRPRVRIGQRVIAATERTRTDPLTGGVGWTYHARVAGLRPGATYGYAVTADNDASAADPFSATFTTAPEGRAAFRFTSFGDLAAAAEDDWQAAYAVGAVEAFQPLFHLLNGDLADSGQNAAAGPARPALPEFANTVQASAANRPWLPVPGGHGAGDQEPGTGDQGPGSFLTGYTLPSNGADGFEGRWYSFRVGTALFVCLSGDDVAYQDAGGPAADPAPQVDASAGTPPAAGGAHSRGRGYSGGAQTRWLETTLAAARGDASIDWIVVQVHQCACSSAAGGGSDAGLRREWLPLFDTYEVDLVLSGHDHGYERSFPVRGADLWAGTDREAGAAADTRRPHPVTTVDSGVFDTSQGTVHLVLGGGMPGSAGSPDRGPGSPARLARVFTQPGRAAPDGPGPDRLVPPAADVIESATWSARRDDSAGYGIAVFDVDPGSEVGRQTSITARYYRAVPADPALPAPGEAGPPSGDYTLFETFTLVRPRSDGRRWHPRR